MSIIVPPGGFAGFAQMTPASRAAWRGTGGRAGTRKRRAKGKKRRAKSAAPRRAKRKLKFGSKAWRKKYLKK